MELHKLPIGIQDFKKLRDEKFFYIDKTAFIYKLVTEGSTYFLSRPRRFGKSLLISTIRAYFEGKKELFEGLAIEKLEAQRNEPWQPHIVIRVDFSTDTFAIAGNLESRLNTFLRYWEQEYGAIESGATFGARFEHIIREAYKRSGRRVVVLIDEYDKPMLDAAGNEELAENNQEVLRGFYSVLKGNDEYLRFVLFSGVTPVDNDVFYGALNSNNISLSEDYATVCGITESELTENFMTEITDMAERNKLSLEKCLATLQDMYGGYRFSAKSECVYNPYSLLNALSEKKFSEYWAKLVKQTEGLRRTPTFLIKKLQQNDYDFRDFTNGVTATPEELSDYRINDPNPIPLFYQSGYLTLYEWNERYREYTLRYPNDEVKYAFISSLAPTLYNMPSNAPELSIVQFSKDIDKGNLEGVMERFKALFARLPYGNANADDDRPTEANFQNAIYIVFILLGKYSEVEMHTARGRADCIVKTDTNIFIFEFKRDGTVTEALSQIAEKGYADAFSADERTVVRVGVAFGTKERNITDWRAE